MLQLRADATLAGGGTPTFGAWAGNRRIVTLVIEVDAVRSRLLATVAEPSWATLEDCTDLLHAVVDHARSISVSAVEIATVDPLLRHAAARSGFEGGLRSPLRRRVEDRVDNRGADHARHDAGAADPADTEGLARTLASLLGVAVAVAPPSGWVAKLARSAVAGFGGMVRWRVDPGDRGPILAVTVPNRDDIMIDSVALAVDTALAVRRRFGAAIGHLRMLSFDHSSHGLKGGRYAGEAHTNASIISLNASFVLARLLDEDRRRWRADPAGAAGRAVLLPPPYTDLEHTTAHELWHQIEASFEARSYGESVEFRRRLGLHLGVETLEHAIQGRQGGSPPAWQAAQRQLVEEVSAYGGTLPGEATAEMFAQWWCPVRPPSPAVSLFAELVERHFPASD